MTGTVQRTARQGALLRTAMVVGSLALGVGLAFAFHVMTDRTPDRAAASANVRGALARALASQGGAYADAAAAPPVASGPIASDSPDAPAPSPDEAVQRFLDFEVARDYDASYGLLSAGDRVRSVTRAGWSAAHADIPAITGYSLGTAEIVSDRAVVPADVRLRAGLTPSSGLIPPRASAQFRTVVEDGGWRVAFGASTLTPRFVPDTRAQVAVRAWAERRARCQRAREYVAGLIGAPERADALCEAEGAIRTGRPRELPETAQDQPFLAAFGGEVHDWARVVRLESPVPMDVVVAPVGEQWLVVGVLQDPSERP